jgi:hypothetical protein
LLRAVALEEVHMLVVAVVLADFCTNLLKFYLKGLIPVL